MKTQTYGISTALLSHEQNKIRNRMMSIRRSIKIQRCAIADYRNKRLNGDENMDAPQYSLPADGKITWIKGRAEENYIYGVWNSNSHDYEYECRYDEGPGDKKWMEECDRNYLGRLEREGILRQKEPQVYARYVWRKVAVLIVFLRATAGGALKYSILPLITHIVNLSKDHRIDENAEKSMISIIGLLGKPKVQNKESVTQAEEPKQHSQAKNVKI
jgi:hypothetical protein